MKLIITDLQYKKIISEAKLNFSDLCNSLGEYSETCRKIEKILKDGRVKVSLEQYPEVFSDMKSYENSKSEDIDTQDKTQEINVTTTTTEKETKPTIRAISIPFFSRVITYEGIFDYVTLKPSNPYYEERLKKLIEFRDILQRHNSCPKMVDEVNEDIEKLPTKGLKMAVDEKGLYSIINRMDSHYTSQAYLLTKLAVAVITEDDPSKLKNFINPTNSQVANILSFILKKEHIEYTAEVLKELLETNEEFKNYLFSALTESKKKGDYVENQVFNFLRNKFGSDNVISFSEDFGFVDYFGVDGVVVDEKGEAHPLQVSTKVKNSPKVFKFVGESCKPWGYVKSGKNMIFYTIHT